MPSQPLSSLQLKVPPVAVTLIAAALIWACARVLPAGEFSLANSVFFAAAIAFAGAASGVAGIARFRAHETTVHPMRPHDASVIVKRGVYGRTRNPMYLGLALLLLGFAVFLENAFSIAVVPLFVLYITEFQIKPEERALLAQFGDEYRDYLQSVRRWI